MSTRNVWKKLKEGKGYRRKFIRTLCIIFSYTTLGIFFSNLGTALPDIQLLIGQDLAMTSWLFTATSIGSLMGTLICGPLCDRIGPQIVLFVSIFAGSCLTGIFIYCPSFTAMLIVRVLTGIFIGGVDIGGIASVTDIWKSDARPYMHALELMLSIGGIITPFIIRPFLAHRSMIQHIVPINESDTATNSSMPSVVPFNVYHINDSKQIEDANVFEVFKICSEKLEKTDFDNNTFDIAHCDNISASNNTREEMTVIGETKIQYAFIILSVIGVIVSFTVLAFLIADCRTTDENSTQVLRDDLKNIDRTKYLISTKLKCILLTLVAFQCYFIAGMSSKVNALLPSYFVLQFSWTTSTASIAMSFFWIGKAVLRLVGVFLSTRFKQSILIPCFCSIYIISAASLSVAGLFQINVFAWISTVTLGIGLSILFPTLITLTEENIAHVSGRIVSLYLVSFVIGSMLDPLYTGYLMEKVSPMWFTYLIFLQSLIFLFIFILVKAILCNCGESRETRMEIESEPMNEVTRK